MTARARNGHLKQEQIMMTVHTKTLDRAQPFSFDVDERIKALELIAAWTADLRSRILDEPEELDLENLDVLGEPQNLEALAAEVEQHRLACKGVRA
jgi:hypothetical protein